MRPCAGPKQGYGADFIENHGQAPTGADLLSFTLEGAAMAMGKLAYWFGRAIRQRTADALSAINLGDAAAMLEVLVTKRARVAFAVQLL
jgi:hypothetical protein